MRMIVRRSKPLRSGLFAQLIEQCRGILEVGGVETFSEPAVNFGEHRPRFIAIPLLDQRSRQARCRTQFPPSRFLPPRDFDRLA